MKSGDQNGNRIKSEQDAQACRNSWYQSSNNKHRADVAENSRKSQPKRKPRHAAQTNQLEEVNNERRMIEWIAVWSRKLISTSAAQQRVICKSSPGHHV